MGDAGGVSNHRIWMTGNGVNESQGWCFVGCIAQFGRAVAGNVDLYLVNCRERQ